MATTFLTPKKVGFFCGLALVQICALDNSSALESFSENGSGLTKDDPTDGVSRDDRLGGHDSSSLEDTLLVGSEDSSDSTGAQASQKTTGTGSEVKLSDVVARLVTELDEGDGAGRSSEGGDERAEEGLGMSSRAVRRLLAELGVGGTSSRRLSSNEDAEQDIPDEREEQQEGVEEDVEQHADEADLGELSQAEEERATSRRLQATEDASVKSLARLLELASRNIEAKIAAEAGLPGGSVPKYTSPPQQVSVAGDGVEDAVQKTRQAANALADAVRVFFESLGELVAKSAEKPLAGASEVAGTVRTKLSEGTEKIGQLKDDVSDRVVKGLTKTISSLLIHVAKNNPELFAEAVQLQEKLSQLRGDVVNYGEKVKDAAGVAAVRAREAAGTAADYALDAAASGADYVSKKAALAHAHLRRPSTEH